MKPQIVVLYLFIAQVLLAFSSISMAAIPVRVPIDKATIITLKEPAKRVSLANPNIADLNLISPYEVLLNGKKLGSTNLIVWDSEGKPTFFDIMVTGDIGSLENQISDIVPGTDVTVETAGDVIILRGSLENEQTKQRLEDLAKAYAPNKDKVINLLEIAEAQQVLLEIRVAQVNKSKLKEMGIGVLLQGVDDNNAEAIFPGLEFAPDGTLGELFVLEKLTKALLPQSQVGGVTTFGSEVTDITLGRSELRPGVTGFDLDNNNPQIGITYFPSDITVLLRALSSKGYAKVLAEPNLVVRSGEEGKFHVGQRFPVQTVTGVGADATVSITYEEVGIRLNFKPEVLATGVVRLTIDPAEVSNIQDFVQLQNLVAPVIDTRTVRTRVDLRPGESLVLAGLLDEGTIKNIQKIPILGDIPIFGALFRSTSDDIKETELAFFVTPKLVNPLPEGETVELPGEKPLTPEEEKQFKWIPMP